MRPGVRGRIAAAVLAAAPVPALAQAVADRPVGLEWSDLPPLPDPAGRAGPFVGVHGQALIVAGGSSEEVWHDEVFVLLPGEAAWRAAGELEHPRAYGAAVSTPLGVVLLGGEGPGGVRADVAVLLWDDAAETLEEDRLPDLPGPTASCAAAELGGWVLVAPGRRSEDPTDLAPGFWGLDLSVDADVRSWVELPAWPGSPRSGALAVVQADGFGVERLHLLSGETARVGDDGEIHSRRLTDGWCFELGQRSWIRIADLPRAAVAGSAVPFGQTHVLVFGGVPATDAQPPLDRGTSFPTDVLAYHTITDTWVLGGEMPLGVASTAAVHWNGGIVVPSGEVRRGECTPRVQRAVRTRFDSSFGTLDTLVLVSYLAVLVGMGWFFSRREKGTDDYFLAGKRLPWWAAGLSIFGTALSAITYLSVPSVSYSSDWRIVWAWFPILLLAPVVIAFFLPVYRKLDLTSAYEYLEHRFGIAVRLFGSVAFIVYQVGRMSIVVYLPALALSAFGGIDVYLCIVVVGGLSTLYTALGGIEAVVWTDVLQVLVLLGGILLALAIALSDVGGVSNALELARGSHKLRAFEGGWSFTELATWSIVFGSLFQNFGPYASDQTTIQRYMSTPDEKSAARGIWMNGILTIPATLLFFALGTCFFAWFKSHPEALAIGMKNDEVFPLFIATRLPAGVSGLVVAGVLAASMSSLDSSMHAIATVSTTDFYRRFRPGVSDARCLAIARTTTVAMGGLGTGAAVWLAASDVDSVFFFFLELLGVASSGVAGVFLLGVFTRRTTSTGALIGAAAGTVAVAWVTWWTDLNLYLYAAVGITTCVVVGYGASLFTASRTDR